MLALALALMPLPAEYNPSHVQAQPQAGPKVVQATGEQLLGIAADALEQGQTELATDIYEALLRDRDQKIRNEARFRLAGMAIARRDWVTASTLLREILDSEPGAVRARIELARVQAEMGHSEAAQRTLREAQAGQLPSDVARFVERFSAALRDRKALGGSIQLAFAGDSNVNRATRSDTLGTVIGDFEIDDDARPTSGTGLSLQADGYFRRQFGNDATLLVRGGLSGDFYRQDRFNDVTAFGSAGPEFKVGKGLGRLQAGYQRRWFGGERFVDAITINFDWQRRLGNRSQFRSGINLVQQDFLENSLQDGDMFGAFAGIEHAFGTRTGAWANIGGARQLARDPAFSTASGSINAGVWREIGRASLVASATYQHLEADRRLAIFPERRREDFLRLSLGATLRALSWRGWAPQVRVIREKNSSSIEINRYNRVRAEAGIVRAF